MDYTIDTYKKRVANNKSTCKGMGGILAIATAVGTQFAEKIECFAKKEGGRVLQSDDINSFVNNVNSGGYNDGQFNNATDQISKVGGSSYRALRSVVLIVIMIAGIIAFAKIAWGSGQGQNDGKSGLVKVALAVCALAALGGFAGLCFEVGSQLTM